MCVPCITLISYNQCLNVVPLMKQYEFSHLFQVNNVPFLQVTISPSMHNRTTLPKRVPHMCYQNHFPNRDL